MDLRFMQYGWIAGDSRVAAIVLCTVYARRPCRWFGENVHGEIRARGTRSSFPLQPVPGAWLTMTAQ